MATFDMSKAAGIITTSPTPILDALAVQYGLPTCLLDLAKEALAAFPSPVLNNIHSGIGAGKSKADELMKEITRRVFLDTGIVEYDTTLGRFVFVSSSSNKGVEQNMLQSMNNMGGLGTLLGFGAQAWLIGQRIQKQIESIKNCIDKVTAFDALQKGPSAYADKLVNFTVSDPTTGQPVKFEAPLPAAEAASLVYEQNKASLENAVSFSNKCRIQMRNIEEITKGRVMDPLVNPEPCFWGDLKDSEGQTLSNLLSATDFCVMDGVRADADGNPLLPTLEGYNPYTDIITATGLMPPLSRGGKFIFSKTGLYYDSYGGGIDLEQFYGDGCISNIVSAVYFDAQGDPWPGIGVPENSMKYLFDYNPNIGGKGECLSLRDFNGWAETVFDLDTINENPDLQEYYEEDHFLQVLIDQRNRHVYDLSGYVTDLQRDYGDDSARVVNQKQLLYTAIADHDSKIKRRKKQIEVHVVLSDIPPLRGEVPINDFTNLDSGKIAIQKSLQEPLIFNTNEVSGIVLPLCPTFIKSEVAQDTFIVEDLMIPTVGVGDIITAASGVAVTSGTVLSLTDKISTDGLVGVYNFLDADLVTPDSNKYLSINCATSSSSDRPLQLVASSMDSMFPSGIGLPYFRGVCNLFSGLDGNTKSIAPQNNGAGFAFSPYRPYGYGRIQSGYDNIDSLLYKNSGCTFETWCCVPDLDDEDSLGWNKDSEVSALHRVILGCENRGGTFSSTNDDWTVPPQYGASVRGLLMGFSRDTRLTKGTAPSNNPADNALGSNLVFYMAPTQSINTSGVTFMTVSAADCYKAEVEGSGHFGFMMDCSTVAGANSARIGDVSSGFRLLTITVDYATNSVSLYLNGDLMKSQSILQTFGIDGPPNLPGLVDDTSFSYANLYKYKLPPIAWKFPPDSIGQTDFWYWDGPDLHSGLTPFTIGGGYTDGMTPLDLGNTFPLPTNEGMNFMGGKWGGRKSGLYGFLGSLKLYNRAITSDEALKNYNAQRGFFENIQI
tara:strand:+ start:9144 stop:12143 length:3000 start_codon:yes stop_codon:yes gene_type:complete